MVLKWILLPWMVDALRFAQPTLFDEVTDAA